MFTSIKRKISELRSKCSTHPSEKCSCFSNNNAIKYTDIVRYSTSKWIWSETHDNALIDTLSNFDYIIPNDIMILIKEHAFHEDEEYMVLQPVIMREKHYSNTKQLLSKNICRKWFDQYELSTHSLLAALHVSDDKNSKQIFESVDNNSLPSLQFRAQSGLYLDKYEQINKTLYIDECRVRLQLIAVNNEKIDDKILKYPAVNIIVVNESEPLINANNTCKKIWDEKKSMENCIMVCVKDPNKKSCQSSYKAIQQLAKYYNIPFIPLSNNTNKPIADLFRFVIKYYW
eukprot:117372_1